MQENEVQDENRLEQDLFQSDNQDEAPEASSVSWTASEFMDHQKTAGWYVLCGVTALVLAIVVFIVTRDLFSPLAVFVLGGILAFAASRKPRTLEYIVDQQGIRVGNKEFLYEDFVSFALVQEGSIESFLLTPVKRWATPLTMYFAPRDGQKIFETLGSYLPFEDKEKDNVDKFLHKIRF